jgi:hypothetical protein
VHFSAGHELFDDLDSSSNRSTFGGASSQVF